MCDVQNMVSGAEEKLLTVPVVGCADIAFFGMSIIPPFRISQQDPVTVIALFRR